MKKIFLISIVLFSVLLASCGGNKENEEDKKMTIEETTSMINKSIQDNDFTTAYNLIDSLRLTRSYVSLSEKLNDKAITAEIMSWIGSDDEEALKATKIIFTIKERSKHNEWMYDPNRLYDQLKELKSQIQYFEKCIDIAQAMDQKVLIQKLQTALNSTKTTYDRVEKEYNKK